MYTTIYIGSSETWNIQGETSKLNGMLMVKERSKGTVWPQGG
jgi:hypothetical protein